MQDDFTLVKSKRRSRKHKNSIQSHCTSFEGDYFDDIKLKRKLTDIVGKLDQHHFTVDLISDIRSALSKLGRTVIDIILCYGLGKFSDNISSLHQLAIVIILQKTFESVIEIFDPVFSLAEIDFLKKFNWSIIEENEEGKRIIEENKLTLVFLPHCPKQLVNNFLWANWSSKLRNCIIIGNSFSEILVNNTERTISDSANYISKAHSFCEEIKVKDCDDYPNAFNDTSIHFFHKLDSNSWVFESPAEEPEYSEDTEFIAKRIGIEKK